MQIFIQSWEILSASFSQSLTIKFYLQSFFYIYMYFKFFQSKQAFRRVDTIIINDYKYICIHVSTNMSYIGTNTYLILPNPIPLRTLATEFCWSKGQIAQKCVVRYMTVFNNMSYELYAIFKAIVRNQFTVLAYSVLCRILIRPIFIFKRHQLQLTSSKLSQRSGFTNIYRSIRTWGLFRWCFPSQSTIFQSCVMAHS